jgi:hypothetical protein
LARFETCAALSTATGHFLFLPVIGKAALQASWQLAIIDKTNDLQTFWFDSARKYLCGSKLPQTDV